MNAIPSENSQPEIQTDPTGYSRLAAHLKAKFPHATSEDVYRAVKVVAETEKTVSLPRAAQSTVFKRGC
ncbi:MAG: hypothetical protein QM760_00270 [Nibricoccus sp.]